MRCWALLNRSPSSALRGGALGVAFKRQVVLGRHYIVDFFAPSVRLVVEVDGGVHRGSRAADSRRDEKLRRLGYRVVRVQAAVVMSDAEAALGGRLGCVEVVAFATTSFALEPTAK